MTQITRAEIEAFIAHAQQAGIKPSADGRYVLLVPPALADAAEAIASEIEHRWLMRVMVQRAFPDRPAVIRRGWRNRHHGKRLRG